MEEGWASQDITVMVSTKLNRSHLYPGKSAYILPCLGRSEMDEQATGNQAVTSEDSFSMINGSIGHLQPYHAIAPLKERTDWFDHSLVVVRALILISVRGIYMWVHR